MSLRRKVTELVHSKPGITLNDLVPLLPECTRDQIQGALRNANGMGLIHCKGRLRGPMPGALPAPYYPGSKEDSPVVSSLARRVAEVIIDKGEGTIDTLRDTFRHISNRDLEKALSAANALGLIRMARKSRPTVWMAGRVPLVKPPKVASVWELASPRDAWPELPQGRVYAPLGGWHSEEAETA
jgi:uncharacterized protein (DUF433 family)